MIGIKNKGDEVWAVAIVEGKPAPFRCIVEDKMDYGQGQIVYVFRNKAKFFFRRPVDLWETEAEVIAVDPYQWLIMQQVESDSITSYQNGATNEMVQ